MEKGKMSGTGVSISVYLGANEQGMETRREIHTRAARRNMQRSEYILFCIQEQAKREDGAEATGHGQSL